MDKYTIMICLKSGGSKVVGTFLTNAKGMVKLGNAFFKSNPETVFPTIVISEGDIMGVEKISVPDTAPGQGVFKTDDEVSRDQYVREKEIVRHEVEEPQAGRECGEEGGWDQFKANSELFDIRPEFDEGEYMDVLDKDSESYKNKLSMARKIEQEILSSSTTDAHRLEERGVNRTEDNDDVYSSVATDKKPRKKVGRESSSKGQQKSIDSRPLGGEAKKKMVIEIEGLSTNEGPRDGKDLEGAVDSRGTGGEACENEEERRSGRQTECDGKQETSKRSVTYGWLNTKFDSSRSMIEAIKSKFRGMFSIDGADQKWGTGPGWESSGKNAVARSMKFSKTSSGSKQASKKVPISK